MLISTWPIWPVAKATPHYTHTQRRIKMGDKNKSGYELRSELLGMAMGIVGDRDDSSI